MSSTSTLARPLLAAPKPEHPPALGLVLLAAVVRAALIAISGLVLVVGVALLLWAVTPNSGSEPTSLIRGGIGAFAAAHLLPVTIGTTTLTLPPMLLTLLFGGFLAAGAARGRIVADGLVAEAASAVLGAAAYTAVVLGAVYLGGPAGAVDLRDGWRAGLFALVAAALGTAVRGTAWRAQWIGGTPHWLQVGVRTGVAGLMMLVAGGAVVLVVALVRSVTTAAAVGEVAAPTAGDAFGMAVLGVVYLPTAVLAATGYATGPGFQIGAGTYSPLGTHGIELPAVPLLAAVPPTGTPHLLTLVVFLVPVVGAVVVGVAVVRRLATRSERLLAAAMAGLTAAAILTALLAVSGGGITGSTWAHLGVPLGWYAAAVAVDVGVPAMAWAGVAGWTGVPWRPAVIGTAERIEGGSEPDESAEATDLDGSGDKAVAGPPEVLVWDITEGRPADQATGLVEASGPDAAEPAEAADPDAPGPVPLAAVDLEGSGLEPADVIEVAADEADQIVERRDRVDAGQDVAETDRLEPDLVDADQDVAETDAREANLVETGTEPNADEPVDPDLVASDPAELDPTDPDVVDPDPSADTAPTAGDGQAAQGAGSARLLRGHRLLRRRRH